MKKFILKNFFAGILICLGFFVTAFIFIKAAGLTATSGTPLSATNWNDMVKNFFWGSGSGGIYYNGKVGIGTSSPNKSLHIKTSAGTNAELDIQSGDSPHWAIYQDESTKSLSIWNGVIRTSISTGGNLNAQGLCINGVCKTDWNQVGGGGVLNYTGTCDMAHKGATGIISNIYKLCNGSFWANIIPAGSYFAGVGTLADPYRSSLESAGASNVEATSCNYYNINAESLNNGTIRSTGTCGGGTKQCLSDGIYRIDPDGVGGNSAFNIYCDMSTSGGGWTLAVKNKVDGATYNGILNRDISQDGFLKPWSYLNFKDLMVKMGSYETSSYWVTFLGAGNSSQTPDAYMNAKAFNASNAVDLAYTSKSALLASVNYVNYFTWKAYSGTPDYDTRLLVLSSNSVEFNDNGCKIGMNDSVVRTCGMNVLRMEYDVRSTWNTSADNGTTSRAGYADFVAGIDKGTLLGGIFIR